MTSLGFGNPFTDMTTSSLKELLLLVLFTSIAWYIHTSPYNDIEAYERELLAQRRDHEIYQAKLPSSADSETSRGKKQASKERSGVAEKTNTTKKHNRPPAQMEEKAMLPSIIEEPALAMEVGMAAPISKTQRTGSCSRSGDRMVFSMIRGVKTSASMGMEAASVVSPDELVQIVESRYKTRISSRVSRSCGAVPSMAGKAKELGQAKDQKTREHQVGDMETETEISDSGVDMVLSREDVEWYESQMMR